MYGTELQRKDFSFPLWICQDPMTDFKWKWQWIEKWFYNLFLMGHDQLLFHLNTQLKYKFGEKMPLQVHMQ